METDLALEKFLQAIPLFEGVGAANLVELLPAVQPVELPRGQVLFREGELGSAMWVLGPDCAVEIAVGSPPRPLATLQGGETLGEMALIDAAPRSASAKVVSAGGAYRIDAQAFEALRAAQRPCAYQVLRNMARDMCLRMRMVGVRLSPEGADAPEPAAQTRVGERLGPSTLEAFGPLRDTPATARLALAQKLTVLDLASGEVLCQEGEVGDAVFLVVEGALQSRRHGTAVLTLSPGALVGLVSALDGGRRSATAVATSPTRVWRLSSRDFELLFAARNRFTYRLVELVARQLAANLRQANATLMAHGDATDEGFLTPESLGELDFNFEL